MIKALLQKGAPVDVRTKDLYTALHIAVEHCKHEAVQTLLGMGATVELKGGVVSKIYFLLIDNNVILMLTIFRIKGV